MEMPAIPAGKKSVMRNLRVPPELWERFKQKHRNVSSKLRALMEEDLSPNGAFHVSRENIPGLKEFIFQAGALPVQIKGNVGVGKTTAIRKLIAADHEHIFIVLDCHNEYSELPEIQTITQDLAESCRLKLPKQVSAARGLYPVYHNQILSQGWPENYVIVLEEAGRYKQARELLREARKFVKVLAICQEALGSFCPVVELTE